MLTLSGPPSVDGLLLPYASLTLPMQVEWVDVSVTSQRRGGRVHRHEARYRARLTWGYEALEPGEAYAIMRVLRRPEFTVIPRTATADDSPVAVEVPLVCRLVSPLPSNKSLVHGLVRLVIECESVGTVTDVVLGLLDGDFVLVGETPGRVEIEATGDATLTDMPFAVVFLGQMHDLTATTLGPDEVAALRSTEVPGRSDLVTVAFADGSTLSSLPE